MHRSPVRAGLAALALLGGITAASATQLHPSVAQPLGQLMSAAQQKCQMGFAVACNIQQQLMAAGNQLMYAQSMCQQGDQNACYQLNMAAMQLQSEVQAMVAQQQQQQPYYGNTGGMSQAERNRAFQQHQDLMRQRSDAMDRSHASFMEYLRQ